MGQALYRKYRSRSLDEVVGQKHITDTLSKALKSGRISHAYLFTGPRGVGKTSVARILAHEINQLPYDATENHIDIIEIDAASNRRIDEIRELRDKVYIAPAQAKYKVYIIDEVHMLTREAFNALLKTLEEPPAHAVFILATTEAHKLPETIVSRTQRFVFRPIDPAQAARHLRTIAQKEHITISDEALELIARHGDGSLRDSSSLLDQAASYGKSIDADVVQTMLGIPSAETIQALLTTLRTGGSPSQLITQLTDAYTHGFQAAAIAKQLAELLREQVMTSTTALSNPRTLALLSALLEVPSSHSPERYLEITLLAALEHPSAPRPEAVSQPPDKAAAKKAHPVAPAVEAAPAPSPKKLPQKDSNSSGVVVTEADWSQVLSSLRSQHNTLYGIVRMAQPDFSIPDKVTLTFAFTFHQKRMNETKNQQIIQAALQTLTGAVITIVCKVDPGLKLAIPKSAVAGTETTDSAAAEMDPSLATISNIFGGGELLQS